MQSLVRFLYVLAGLVIGVVLDLVAVGIMLIVTVKITAAIGVILLILGLCILGGIVCFFLDPLSLD